LMTVSSKFESVKVCTFSAAMVSPFARSLVRRP
jgi:hypothetical protein